MGEPEQVDHAAACIPSGQRRGERGPGGGVFGAREETVTVDRSGQRLRLAAERVDDVAIVDAVEADAVAAAAQARMADDMGGAEPGLDPVVGDVDAQALADQPRGSGS